MNDSSRPDVDVRDPSLRAILFRGYLSVLTALLVGYIWNARPNMSPNDNSRWNTVWSLVEFGTYQIFDTEEEAKKADKPIQFPTIDKVSKDGKFYSSKPPLVPTVMAGFVRGMKVIVGVPFTKELPDTPGTGSNHIYARACLYLFQVAPFLVFLVLYGRLLGRCDLGWYAWGVCALAAGLGTYVTGYLVTLNNHVMAATFGFISAYLLMTIWYDGAREWWRFILLGLCVGWTAANELPAGLLVLVALAVVLWADRVKALLGFIPALALVTAAFFGTNYLAIGTLSPAYIQHELYDYPGSHFRRHEHSTTESAAAPAGTPKVSNIDALSDHPESKLVYFVHMTVGHHGLFSLTPLWVIAAWGWWLSLSRGAGPWKHLHWPIAFMSAGVFIFYWLVNDQRNYGGFCQGMRWLLWLGPLWLLFLPAGAADLSRSLVGRRLVWASLLVSIFSMAQALYVPWSRSWLHRILLWFGVIDY